MTKALRLKVAVIAFSMCVLPMEGMMYKLQKYKWWELWFYKYKFVRKLSGAFWVRLLEDGYDWVKFDREKFYSMTFKPTTKFEVEDWTAK
jgi:hypothetical protein